MRTRFLWPAAAVVAVVGCQSYQPKPLEPEEILAAEVGASAEEVRKLREAGVVV